MKPIGPQDRQHFGVNPNSKAGSVGGQNPSTNRYSSRSFGNRVVSRAPDQSFTMIDRDTKTKAQVNDSLDSMSITFGKKYKPKHCFVMRMVGKAGYQGYDPANLYGTLRKIKGDDGEKLIKKNSLSYLLDGPIEAKTFITKSLKEYKSALDNLARDEKEFADNKRYRQVKRVHKRQTQLKALVERAGSRIGLNPEGMDALVKFSEEQLQQLMGHYNTARIGELNGSLLYISSKGLLEELIQKEPQELPNELVNMVRKR